MDSQAGKPCYQICHGRSLTTTRIVVMIFCARKNKGLLSKECNSVTSNLATRDIYSTIAVLSPAATAASTSHMIPIMRVRFTAWILPPGLSFVFIPHVERSITISRYLVVHPFWNLVIQKIVKVGKCLSSDWRQPRQATQSCYPPLSLYRHTLFIPRLGYSIA